MKNNFSRIITYLRKERGLSQKKVAQDLEISQALLSHYEKGIRECGLDFLIRTANYYDVSCDYLLGRTSDRQGVSINIGSEQAADEINSNKVTSTSLMVLINKKIILNSISILFDLLIKINNKTLTKHISNYIMVAVYKMFRTIYSANKDNLMSAFSISESKYKNFSDAYMLICGSKAIDDTQNPKNAARITQLSSNILMQEYPEQASSLFNLVSSAEKAINKKIT